MRRNPNACLRALHTRERNRERVHDTAIDRRSAQAQGEAQTRAGMPPTHEDDASHLPAAPSDCPLLRVACSTARAVRDRRALSDASNRGREVLRIMTVRIGVGLGLGGFPFETIRDFRRWLDACEDSSIDSIWQSDRVISRDLSLIHI